MTTLTHAAGNKKSESTNLVKPDRIMQYAWGYALPLVIEAAMSNHVFDALDAGPLTLDQLVEKTGASARGLRMIADVLVSFELLTRQGDCYALVPESATFLVSTKPTFQGGIYHHISSQLIPKWLQISKIVRTGRAGTAVNNEAPGAEFFEQFVEDIFPMSYRAAQVLAEALKIPTASKPLRVLDIASGSGVWGIALAQKSPQVRVTAVDWANVITVTRRVTKKHGVADRFSFVAGDINQVELGDAYDVATLGHILHSEGERRSRALLGRVFNALAPGGTIAIAEFLVEEGRTAPPMGLIFAVNMLVNTDAGDTFSFNQISSWLREIGFVEPRTLEAPAPSPLILATKPR